MPGKRKQVAALGLFVLIVFAAGGIGGLATASSVTTWYRTLQRPGMTPPSWLFQPVWTALYVSMAFAAWLVWRKGGAASKPALAAFAVQLALNAAWSVLFFGLRSPVAGLADIVLLWLAIVATVILFSRVSVPAAAILTPYLAWVSFAAVLNYEFWRLN